MPKIEKQTVRAPQPPPNGAQVRAGSVLSRAISVADVAEDVVKMVLYGQNRVGKTTLSCQAPKPLLLVSFEPDKTGGAVSVKRVPGVKLLVLTRTTDAIALANELAGGAVCDLPEQYQGKPYRSVVLDSVTSLQDIVLAELMNVAEAPVQLDWGLVGETQYRERAEKTKEILRRYTNLQRYNIIFNAKEKDHNANKGDRKPRILRKLEVESYFAADLGGSTVGWLQDACGYIARLYIDRETVTREVQVGKETKTVEEETGRMVHRLLTMYHPNFAAGFRSCTPEAVPQWIDEPTWDSLYRVICGERIPNGKYLD